MQKHVDVGCRANTEQQAGAATLKVVQATIFGAQEADDETVVSHNGNRQRLKEASLTHHDKAPSRATDVHTCVTEHPFGRRATKVVLLLTCAHFSTLE
eukprot:4064456-Amphidinium_carterae.1